jgi:hypothetical protein
MIYSYKDKGGHLVTKIFVNESDGPSRRKWVDASTEPETLQKLMPPQQISDVIFPFAEAGIGDTGVRFTKFDSHRIGVLRGFQAGATQCSFSGGFPPQFTCNAIPTQPILKAFAFDGKTWTPSPNYTPPLPFVTQYAAPDKPSIDLFLQLARIMRSGLAGVA